MSQRISVNKLYPDNILQHCICRKSHHFLIHYHRKDWSYSFSSAFHSKSNSFLEVILISRTYTHVSFFKVPCNRKVYLFLICLVSVMNHRKDVYFNFMIANIRKKSNSWNHFSLINMKIYFPNFLSLVL